MSSEMKQKGFDSSVSSREEDHLNRWPVAQEIYGIPNTGPLEWSVRIGIYGEWGTGKTTILNFVEIMAVKDGHIVVHFNPWEYPTRETLWQAFVLSVYKELEKQIGTVSGSSKVRLKKWGEKIGGTVTKIISLAAGTINETARDVVDAGFGLLKRFFIFNPDDLENLKELLDNRRLIVLIDDLDRTNPDLVPEILFALKEIMDVPGFVFVCAFDPLVVGEVLGKFHPGFGDGLRFLEKIVDYPRWLPAPTPEGIRSLSHADISQYCPYIPLPAMDETLPFLPRNPRVLRKFIRLLSLLKPQIERHYDHELVWSVILMANVFKVLYPHLAQEIFGNKNIWSEISAAYFALNIKKEDEDSFGKLLSEHFEISCKKFAPNLSIEDHERGLNILRKIAELSFPWLIDYKLLFYQIHIAEEPHAVTWKEYDQFKSGFEENPTNTFIGGWINQHSISVGQKSSDVYLELVDATIRSRDIAMGQVADTPLKEEMSQKIKLADQLLTLLEELVFDFGKQSTFGKKIREDQVKEIISSLFKYISWTTIKEYKGLREREESFLKRFVSEWSSDITILTNVLRPFSERPDHFSKREQKNLRKELCAIVIPTFARKILEGFRKQQYIKQRVWGNVEGSYDVKIVLLNIDGPLWKGLRKDILKILSKASEEINIQTNAFELLEWFNYKFKKERDYEETKEAEKIVKNRIICHALWKAATVSPLNPCFIGEIRGLPEKVKGLGVNLKIPKWWKLAMKELIKASNK